MIKYSKQLAVLEKVCLDQLETIFKSYMYVIGRSNGNENYDRHKSCIQRIERVSKSYTIIREKLKKNLGVKEGDNGYIKQ